jgi:phytoene/squalene synthetase
MLAVAVTEDLFYFIGHGDVSPCEETRYHAVCGAHVVHLLRDSQEDISAGYFNIPGEYIQESQVCLEELRSPSFRKWVYERVRLARLYFALGRQYFSKVKSMRCRLACAAYLARFEWLLNRIEQDGYCLRETYPERKSLKAVLWMVWRVITSSLNMSWLNADPGEQEALPEQGEEG